MKKNECKCAALFAVCATLLLTACGGGGGGGGAAPASVNKDIATASGTSTKTLVAEKWIPLEKIIFDGTVPVSFPGNPQKIQKCLEVAEISVMTSIT